MNTLREAINDYLAMRRGLGFKLIQMECWLWDFAAFMEAQSALCVTIELALHWAMQSADAHPSCWAKRLTAVRCFARHRSAADPRTEIPVWGLLPYGPKRAKPYLCTEQEIEHLMQAAKALPPSNGVRGWTSYCLFGLLAVTGLRISEALALKRRDVDLQRGLLTIRGAKFNKCRLVPLHPSTGEACRNTRNGAMRTSSIRRRPTSWSRSMAERWRHPPFARPFASSPARPGCAGQRLAPGLACTTSVTA
jgi:integrase/recombinase XerD